MRTLRACGVKGCLISKKYFFLGGGVMSYMEDAPVLWGDGDFMDKIKLN